MKTKNLVVIDGMYRSINEISYTDVFSNRLKINPLINDNAVADDSPIIGQIREMVVKNCYFKYLKFPRNSQFDVVVDLGANRGLFSLMLSKLSRHVYMVEVNGKYEKVIKHNFKTNGLNNYSLSNIYIGNSGMYWNENLVVTTFSAWTSERGISKIDLLKMDIEGSEFSIFEEDYDWSRVHYITMEVHPECGDPALIYKKLLSFNFEITTTNSLLKKVRDVSKADYIFAINKNWN